MIQLDTTAEVVEMPDRYIADRPDVILGEIYKLKTPKVNNSIYVTIGFVEELGGKRPFELFINSKDLTKAPEYAVLTRLISAIFRSAKNPEFVVEELRSIHDPNGGYFSNGKYMHSFYSEIADIIEHSLSSGVKKPKKKTMSIVGDSSPEGHQEGELENNMMLCPQCQQKTAKYENGCMTCTDPECGFSKCDH